MIQLGDKVTDGVTGFSGIATARTTFLTGCDRIEVTSKSVDGRPADFAMFDEDRLIASLCDLCVMKNGSQAKDATE